ncbi:hypothetical protein PMIN06_001147 [Paraphaeosphaeria minitans]
MYPPLSPYSSMSVFGIPFSTHLCIENIAPRLRLHSTDTANALESATITHPTIHPPHPSLHKRQTLPALYAAHTYPIPPPHFTLPIHIFHLTIAITIHHSTQPLVFRPHRRPKAYIHPYV